MEGLMEFWELASRLKREKRRGWMQKLQLSDVESVADHSFAVGMLSLYEGERRGYNMEKLLKMALIHDLEEAVTGDLTPRDRQRKGARGVVRMRASAEAQILAGMPSQTRSEYRRLWTDLKLGTSREARLVKNLDRLEMALQAKEYEAQGARREKLAEFISLTFGQLKKPEVECFFIDLAVTPYRYIHHLFKLLWRKTRQ